MEDGPYAIVMAPSRELVIQIEEEALGTSKDMLNARKWPRI